MSRILTIVTCKNWLSNTYLSWKFTWKEKFEVILWEIKPLAQTPGMNLKTQGAGRSKALMTVLQDQASGGQANPELLEWGFYPPPHARHSHSSSLAWVTTGSIIFPRKSPGSVSLPLSGFSCASILMAITSAGCHSRLVVLENRPLQVFIFYSMILVSQMAVNMRKQNVKSYILLLCTIFFMLYIYLLTHGRYFIISWGLYSLRWMVGYCILCFITSLLSCFCLETSNPTNY